MSASSFISSSEAKSDSPVRAGAWRRLAFFVAPYLAAGALFLSALMYTGEFLPVRYVAWLQSQGVPFLYLPATSEHNFRFKVEAVKAIRPEVLAIGPSRANQFRNEMFAPTKFYNAGNSVYVLRDYERLLEEVGAPFPRVVIFSLDFYFFNNVWDTGGRGANVSYGDVPSWGTPEHRTTLRTFIKIAARHPHLLLPVQTDPYGGSLALGFLAAQRGKGFRTDGSLQYGDVLRGDLKSAGVKSLAVEVQRIDKGKRPFVFGDRLDAERLHELERFAQFARSHQITLVGITMPYAPEMVAAMDASRRHDIWREFLRPETAQKFRDLGIMYFDFTNLKSFAGRPDEFVDGLHASETAVLRMLLTMLHKREFAELFPAIRREHLARKLEAATPLVAFE